MNPPSTPTVVIGSGDLPQQDPVIDYKPEAVKGVVYQVAVTAPDARK